MQTFGYLCIHSNSLTEALSNRKCKRAITKSNLLFTAELFYTWRKVEFRCNPDAHPSGDETPQNESLNMWKPHKRANLKWHSLVRKNSLVLCIRAKFLLSQQ